MRSRSKIQHADDRAHRMRKTYLVKTLARLLDVPLAIADATSLTEAGYIGDDIESVISRLLAAADNDVERQSRESSLLMRLIKSRKRKTPPADVSGESVQQGMLKLLRGKRGGGAGGSHQQKTPWFPWPL